MQPWQHSKPTEEIKVGWRYLVRKTFIDPEGVEQEYMTMARLHTQCVATIALTEDNKVVIAEQFRPGPEKIMQEIPGGLAYKDEDLAEAAARELHEETGYAAKHIAHLGTVYKDAYSNAVWNFFLAEGCHVDGEQHTDDGEHIVVKLIDIDTFFENARTHMMTDVEAVFLAYERLQTIKGGDNDKTN